MGECDVELRDVVKRSLQAVGGWVYRRVELRGVEHGSVHVKFRFQPADVGMREKTPEARERYLARHKSRMRRKAERRSVDGKGDGLKRYPDTAMDDGDEGPEKVVHFDAGDVGQEDYFDFGSDDEPSSEDETDAELRSHPSSSPTRLKVTDDEGGPSPPPSPPRRGLFGRKK